MPRIPPTEIERLKREASVAELVKAAGIALAPHGSNGDLAGRCPFHEDQTASLVVSREKNLYHCFGCGAGGDPIQWVMAREKASFRHAVQVLQEKLDSGGLAAAAAVDGKLRLANPLVPTAEDRLLLPQVMKFYRDSLGKSAEAQAYLTRRGLGQGEALAQFGAGYADGSLGLRLPPPTRQAGRTMREALRRLGVIRATGHEHFRGCVVFPIVDPDSGHILGIYGRRIDDSNAHKGASKHLYLPGAHKGVWNADGVRAAGASGGEVILCEALLDALTFWIAGHRQVTCAYGVNGFTADHLDLFRSCGIRRVLIAYDRDEAGERGAEALAAQLARDLPQASIYRVQFPKGMDANAYAAKVQPAGQALGLLLKAAVPLHEPMPPAPPSPPSSEVQKPQENKPQEASAEGISPPVVPAEVAPAVPASSVAPASSLAASPVPPSPDALQVEATAEQVILRTGDRKYRVRGLTKNLAFEVMKVNLLVSRERCEAFHVDTLDLYASRHRAGFIGQAAKELGLEEGTLQKDLGRVLLKLESLQEELIRAATAPKAAQVPEMAEADRVEALELLRSPDLLGRILADFQRCGVVGEETNKLLGYLAATSRKLEGPLAVVIQSSSAAGKTSLMDAVLSLMPPEEVLRYSAMTSQSLYYMGAMDVRHKVLAIAEEEGAEQASYALKLLQSEKELTIASTGKDPGTNRLETQEYKVEGPVMIFLTTTAVDVDEELMNRCLVLAVDEDRSQTKAIHDLQRKRETLKGLLETQEKEALLRLHRNAQRLLKTVLVANPYAEGLSFLDDKTRTRRDHVKYLTLIRAIALLHQHQRPRKTAYHRGKAVEYIEVSKADITTANRLMAEVLGRCADELPSQTRRLLGMIEAQVKAGCAKLKMERRDYRFTRREVREGSGWSNTQLRIHMDRLTELEYLLVHRGGRGQSFVYELTYESRTGAKGWAACLKDPEQLGRVCDENLTGQEPHLAGSKRGQNGPLAVGLPDEESPSNAEESSSFSSSSSNQEQKAQVVGEVAPRCTEEPSDPSFFAAEPAAKKENAAKQESAEVAQEVAHAS